jgi:protein TonB
MTVGAAKEPIKSGKPDKPSVSSGAYAGKVHAAIARNRQRIKGASGSATVTFTIGPAGAISGARVTRSSGKPELDRAAVASVRGAALPAPPPGAKSTYSIQIYFR